MKIKTNLFLLFKLILALSLMLGIFSTCSRKSFITNPSDQASPLLLKLNFVETALLDLIQSVRLTVSSEGDTLIEKHLDLKDGAISDTIQVQAGENRVFTLEALDSFDLAIYRGVDTADVTGGDTTWVEINLYPVVFLLKLDPVYQEVYNDSLFNVDVKLYNVEDLFGISFRVEFDPAVLLCTDVEFGDFLGPSESTIFFSKVDSVKGYVAIGYSRIQGSVSGVSGNGRLATLYFKPKEEARESPTSVDLIFNEETLTFYDPYGERKDWKDSLYIHNAQVAIQ